jgi:hypothetical protein
LEGKKNELTAHEVGDHAVESRALEVERLSRLAGALLASAKRTEAEK